MKHQLSDRLADVPCCRRALAIRECASRGRTARGAVGAMMAAVLLSLPAPATAFTMIPAPSTVDNAGLAWDGSSLYVGAATGPRVVWRIDPADGTILDTFPMPGPTGFDGGTEPIDFGYDGASHLLVSGISFSSGGGIVYEIDTAGTTIFNSFVPPFRSAAIVFDGSQLYTGDFDSSLVRVTDRTGATLLGSFTPSFRPSSMDYDGLSGRLFATEMGTNQIWVLSTAGVVQDSYPGPHVGTSPSGRSGIAAVGSRLYILGRSAPDGVGADAIFVLDSVCGDGDLGPGEQCDDGNTVAGDCCSPTCQYESAGGACPGNGLGCTADVCNDAGLCLHPLLTTPACQKKNQKCIADKLKASGKYALCRLKTEARSVRTDTPPDFADCDDQLTTTWSLVETRADGACPRIGEVEEVRTELSECSDTTTSIIKGEVP